ncbi:MAG: MltA domain-containing protein [Thiomonas sp.]|nr:MltA domain-containing protein [Thiomonas sp.]
MSVLPHRPGLLRHPRAVLLGVLGLMLASCATPPSPPPANITSSPAEMAPWPATPPGTATTLTGPGVKLLPARWADLPGWTQDDFAGVWQAFRRDCGARLPAALAAVCARAAAVPAGDTQAQRAFIEVQFAPWQVTPASGKDNGGLITGYYAPVLHGALTRAWPYVVPVWGLPADLAPRAPGADGITGGRVAWVDGQQRVLPFWSRAQIQSDPAVQARLDRNTVVWLDSAVDALFLQVQGSGLVRLPDGQTLRLSYAGTNGWPYKSVGRWLLDTDRVQGTVTMSTIRAWAQMHPDEVPEMLAANPRVVFFSAALDTQPQRGPTGALGVPLTAMRSIAVDKRAIALGLPVWLSTSQPYDGKTSAPQALNRLVFAQDVGSAITGAVRADLFTGTGEAAGELAGRMQWPGKMWVLLPVNP